MKVDDVEVLINEIYPAIANTPLFKRWYDPDTRTIRADLYNADIVLLVKAFRVMRKLAHDLTPFTERKTPAWVDATFEERMRDAD